ncbi:TorF family putative porin [Microbulbifer sp. OS29]|uniref:TorF family putative porin n=1 Tax=Microbulbifer okhotskensis TaxID=2926617 RepID=A0A9X2ESE0_9GAMM|nr:TorF family putative porin [Microbulbifer okhotskensis]MCO1334866.1 TorF family putative porin [Microbulbifer okhotskensis]
MHKIAALITVAAFALGIVSPSAAAETGPSFSANVGVVSDYKFRGITQTDGGPALQGGVDADLGNGIYLGTWASQVDFDYGSDETDYEQDFYGGYSADINETVSFDVGYIYYAYHGGDRDEDYQEVYGSLSFSDLTLGLAYSDDYWAESGEFYYPYAEYSFALPAELTLDLHLGLNLFDEEVFLYESDSYFDYSVTVSKEVGGLSLSASFVGTDVSDKECFDTDWCEPSLLAGATYTW